MINSLSYLVRQGFKNLWNNSFMTLASIGVLVSCMLLIGAAALLSINISSAMENIEDNSEAIVYLYDGLSDEELEQIRNGIIATGKISSVEFISKDDALRDMMSSLGDNGVLFDAYSQDGNNNLPDSYRVVFDDVSDFGRTISSIKKLEGVESVSALTDVADVITGVKRMAYVGGIGIIGLLILVSLMIISNTIKITVFNRKREINIMKYVGATNGFIRLPFVIEGMTIGMISGLLSFGIVFLAYDYITRWVLSNQGGWFSEIISEVVPFSNISLQLFVGFVFGGAIIGMIGCFTSSSKYLKV